MFTPKYTITQRLLANIKTIAKKVNELNRRQFSKVVLFDFEKMAREISVHSSTSIEGNPLPLTEVKKILRNNPKNARDSEKEVINYNTALIELNKLVHEKNIKFDLQLILRIQKNIMRQLVNKNNLGKIRKESVFVNDPRTRKTIYWPPDHQDVPQLVKELLDYLNSNELDSLIAAGLFHKQFVIIHPFIDGNGRTTRLATKVLLASMGLSTFNLFSFENYYNQNVSKYFTNVGVLGNYYDIKDKVDFTAWLEYFTDGILDELFRVEKELDKTNIIPTNILKEFHNKIIQHIKQHEYITDRDYSKLTKRAKATRNLDFNKLLKAWYHPKIRQRQGNLL